MTHRLYPIQTHKHCSRCKRWLPNEAFRANPKLKSGLSSWCRNCAVERTRQWRRDNPDYVAAYNTRRRNPPRASRSEDERRRDRATRQRAYRAANLAEQRQRESEYNRTRRKPSSPTPSIRKIQTGANHMSKKTSVNPVVVPPKGGFTQEPPVRWPATGAGTGFPDATKAAALQDNPTGKTVPGKASK